MRLHCNAICINDACVFMFAAICMDTVNFKMNISPQAKMAEAEACMATYLWFVQLRIFNGRLLTQCEL